MPVIAGRTRRLGAIVLGLGVCVVLCQSGEADPPDAPAVPVDMKQILERLEKLEKRNDALEKRNEELEKAIRQQAGPSQPGRLASEGNAGAVEPAADSQTVKQLVDDYLKADAEQKKAAAEQKRLESEAQGFEVGKDRTNGGLDEQRADVADSRRGLPVPRRCPPAVRHHRLQRHASGRPVDRELQQVFRPEPRFGTWERFPACSSAALRRAYEIFDFICEYDFANDINLSRRSLGITPAVTSTTTPLTNDVDPTGLTRFTQDWIGVNKLPVIGTFRAGHQREWVTFNNTSAAADLPFMERPLAWNAFVSPFNFESGYTIQRNYLNERAYSWFGIFKDDTLIGGNATGAGNWSYSGKVTCLPVWRRRQHLGPPRRRRQPPDPPISAGFL